MCFPESGIGKADSWHDLGGEDVSSVAEHGAEHIEESLQGDEIIARRDMVTCLLIIN